MNMSIIERAALVAHETNRAWCKTMGDYIQPSWENAPDWQKESVIAGVKFHISNPNANDSASHDSWLKQKLDDGWMYGEVKDSKNKTHPCLVPFWMLPVEQQIKDALFRSVVHSVLKLNRVKG